MAVLTAIQETISQRLDETGGMCLGCDARDAHTPEGLCYPCDAADARYRYETDPEAYCLCCGDPARHDGLCNRCYTGLAGA